MAGDPVAGEDGAGEADFSSEDGGGADLGEFVGFAFAVAAEEVEALALGGEAGAAAVGGYDEAGEGDRPVVVAGGGELGVGDGGVGFGDVGGVLAGGDEEAGQPVSGVGSVVGGTGEEGSRVRDLAHAEELLRGDAHDGLEERGGEGDFSDDALAAGHEGVDGGVFFVGIDVAGEDVADGAGVGGDDVLAGGEGGFGDHVLAGGVAGGVVEAEVEEVADVEGRYGGEKADGGGGFGGGFDGGEVLLDPF